jgi:hypothetical protein
MNNIFPLISITFCDEKEVFGKNITNSFRLDWILPTQRDYLTESDFLNWQQQISASFSMLLPQWKEWIFNRILSPSLSTQVSKFAYLVNSNLSLNIILLNVGVNFNSSASGRNTELHVSTVLHIIYLWN